MTGDPHTPRLAGLRVLVAEDEWMIADDMACALEAAGAVVLGPVATVHEAVGIVEEEQPNAALLDLKLADGMVYPLAAMLLMRRVPVIFTTGYDAGSLPGRYEHVPKIEKPASTELILEQLEQCSSQS